MTVGQYDGPEGGHFAGAHPLGRRSLAGIPSTLMVAARTALRDAAQRAAFAGGARRVLRALRVLFGAESNVTAGEPP